jgi:hypothetical protein
MMVGTTRSVIAETSRASLESHINPPPASTALWIAGSPQDILDAQSAYRSAQAPVDLDLLRVVARRFGRDVADKLEQILAN